MAEERAFRIYLADLVMAALVCGLMLALFTSVESGAGAAVVIVLLSVVLACWSLFHQGRQAPTCEEYGRRFIQPKKRTMPSSCPHCGREQSRRAAGIRRWRRTFWILLGMLFPILAAACVLISGLGGPREFAGIIGGGIAMVLAMLTIFSLFGVAVYRSALEAPKDRPCEACGEVIAVVVDEGPKVCPQCRVRHMSAEQARKEQAKGCGLLVVLLVILAGFGAMMLRPAAGVAPAGDSWIQSPLSVLMFMGLGAAACFILLVFRQVARLRKLRSDGGAIAMARRSAGEEGEVIRDGDSFIWYSGRDDPTPMIRNQTELARRRFEAMTGLEVADAPLRALVFHDRGAFLRFHRRIHPGMDFTSYSSSATGRPPTGRSETDWARS